MATLGILNDLNVLRLSPEGAYLDGGADGEVLLPLRQVPKGCEPGQILKVFVYLDAEDYFTASTRPPLAQRGEAAYLKIAGVNKTGAFLVWGMPQDLFLPWKEVRHEQKVQIREGQKVMVIVFQDESGRVLASTRLENFLSDEAEGFAEGDKVSLVIGEPTDLGVRVIVNHRYWGMVHSNDIFTPLSKGETREGYVKALRPDHKLNISLTAPGYAKVDALAPGILAVLKRQGGFLAVTDKSKPEEIYALFGISKKAFKQTLGTLYKNKQIVIETDGIRLAPRHE